jgi:uncharacterized membrane protein
VNFGGADQRCPVGGADQRCPVGGADQRCALGGADQHCALGGADQHCALGWLGLVTLIGVQIAYPLVSGDTRAALVIATVLLGWVLSVGHALATRGRRVAAILATVTTGGGLVVEAIGVHTGFPFGAYAYGHALGTELFGVPLVVPLAWTWMAWPAWLAGLGLAAWDLFLDPQMVREGYWHWSRPEPSLPAVTDVPVTNYVGWLAVALAMMALLSAGAGPTPTGDAPTGHRDAPMLGVYLWTYYSSVLAHAVFLGLPASALWGGLGMGSVAIPLTVRLIRR